MTSTKKMVRLSLFLAISVLLHYIESFIPVTFIVPGVKLGLANIAGLVVLYFYTPKDFLFIGFLRVLIVALLRTGFGTPFMLAFSGWALSSIVVILLVEYVKPSIYGLSIVSAAFHSIGQVLMVVIIYETIGMINYLPVLLITSMISGAAIAFVSAKVLKRLDTILLI